MPTIAECLAKIRNAIYGEEVRGSIIDAITQCYSDVQNSLTGVDAATATANQAAAAANQAADTANAAALGITSYEGEIADALAATNLVKYWESGVVSSTSGSLTGTRAGSRFIINGTDNTYSFRYFKLDGTPVLERCVSSNRPSVRQSFSKDLYLKAGHTYRLSSTYVSGTISTTNEADDHTERLYIYDLLDTVISRADVGYASTFTCDVDVNCMLVCYLSIHNTATYSNYTVDVKFEDITDTGRYAASSDIVDGSMLSYVEPVKASYTLPSEDVIKYSAIAYAFKTGHSYLIKISPDTNYSSRTSGNYAFGFEIAAENVSTSATYTQTNRSPIRSFTFTEYADMLGKSSEIIFTAQMDGNYLGFYLQSATVCTVDIEIRELKFSDAAAFEASYIKAHPQTRRYANLALLQGGFDRATKLAAESETSATAYTRYAVPINTKISVPTGYFCRIAFYAGYLDAANFAMYSPSTKYYGMVYPEIEAHKLGITNAETIQLFISKDPYDSSVPLASSDIELMEFGTVIHVLDEWSYSQYKTVSSGTSDEFRQTGLTRTGENLGGSYRNRTMVTSAFVPDYVDGVVVNESKLYFWVAMYDDQGTYVGFESASTGELANASSSPLIYYPDYVDLTRIRAKFPECTKLKLSLVKPPGYTLLVDEHYGALTYLCDPFKYYAAKGGQSEMLSIFDEELATTVNTIKSLQTEPTLVFPVCTDIHYDSVDKIVFPEMIKNMNALMAQVRVDGVWCLGDLHDGSYSLSNIRPLLTELQNGFMSLRAPLYFAAGNHDNNGYTGGTRFNTSDMFKEYYAYMGDNAVSWDYDNYGVNFTIDYHNFKVRFISLDASNSEDTPAGRYKYPGTTKDWFDAALNATPAGYLVVLMTHLSPFETHNANDQGVSQGSYVKQSITNWLAADDSHTIVSLIGHSHSDFYYTDPYLAIGINCNKVAWTSYPDTVITQEDLDEHSEWVSKVGWQKWHRSYDDYTMDCWDVLVLRPFSRRLDMVRFGAGVDRSFTY